MIAKLSYKLKVFLGKQLRTPDLSQQPVLGIKEIPWAGSCEPVDPHHW